MFGISIWVYGKQVVRHDDPCGECQQNCCEEANIVISEGDCDPYIRAIPRTVLISNYNIAYGDMGVIKSATYLTVEFHKIMLSNPRIMLK